MADCAAMLKVREAVSTDAADILSLVGFPFPVVPIVRCHHENWDGSGYPNRIAGEAIPIGARILSVVDCFDALTSERPYKQAWSLEEARAAIVKGSGSQFDPECVDAFVRRWDAVVEVYRGAVSQPLPQTVEEEAAPAV